MLKYVCARVHVCGGQSFMPSFFLNCFSMVDFEAGSLLLPLFLSRYSRLAGLMAAGWLLCLDNPSHCRRVLGYLQLHPAFHSLQLQGIQLTREGFLSLSFAAIFSWLKNLQQKSDSDSPKKTTQAVFRFPRSKEVRPLVNVQVGGSEWCWGQR